MKNEFLLYVKLLAINPETGVAFEPPCELQPQIAVHLNYYLQDFRRSENFNTGAYQSAVEEILQKLFEAFKAPMGWLIEMQSIDEFFATGNPFYESEKRISEEFFYSPADGAVKVDVEFLYQSIGGKLR